MGCTGISFIFAFALAFVGTFADEPEKLMNGTPTTIEEYPHAVSFRMDGKHFCGGSIISPRHILTAAHCVESFKYNRVTVVTGTTHLDKGGNTYKIEDAFAHEKHVESKWERVEGFDIAVVKLAEPITFNEHQKAIALPKSILSENEPCTLVAWGTTYFGGPVHNNLQKINAKTMLVDECQIRHILTMKVHEDEFCTLVRRGIGACGGDSGSGIVRENDGTVIGIISGGMPCGKNLPDIHTTVFPYLTWIKEKMAL